MATTDGITNGLPALATSAEDFLKHKYDYVIVGGGTAGLVVAARLTEDPNVTVGVLEAGSNKLGDALIDTPAAFPQMLGLEGYDWGFRTEPQPANQNKRHHLPRGKVLGGSSAINFTMYVRGSEQDYDDWAELTGDPSWGHKAMAPYMRKHQTLESFDPSTTDRSTFSIVDEYHGTSGPIRTSFNPPPKLQLEDDWIRAADEVVGCAAKPNDPWSGDHIGFYHTLGTVARNGPDKGKRSYAARDYFAVNAHRANLHVLCNAPVNFVELVGNQATGVNFTFHGEQHSVQAKREVIVSCGALQTPQILELSGIGDPEILRKAGVRLKVENRGVGRNYQDHILTGAGYEMNQGTYTVDIMHNAGFMAEAEKALLETQDGPLTCLPTMQGFFPYKASPTARFASADEQEAIIKSIEDSMPNITPFQRKQFQLIINHLKDGKSANLQVLLIPSTLGWDTGTEDQSKLFVPPATPESLHHISPVLALQYPVSRGTVHIKTSSINDPPSIDPGFLTHDADIAVLAAGLKMLDGVAKTKYLKDQISARVAPKPDVDLQDLEQARARVKEWCLSEYHSCGSCAMGDAVDSRLRVIGVKGLRVVDASVFPNHVSGNIVSSVYAVAEKAADLIKEEWQEGDKVRDIKGKL